MKAFRIKVAGVEKKQMLTSSETIFTKFNVVNYFNYSIQVQKLHFLAHFSLVLE